MLRTLKKIQPQSLPISKSTLCLHRILIGLKLSPNQFRILQNSLHQDAAQSREQYQNNQRSQLEDIPELEDEDWEDRQFTDADLIDHHNTTIESDRICWEYSTHFEKSADQEYNSQNNTTPGLGYYIPEPEYYNLDTRPKQYKTYQNLNVYLSPPPDTDDLRRWHGRGQGRSK